MDRAALLWARAGVLYDLRARFGDAAVWRWLQWTPGFGVRRRVVSRDGRLWRSESDAARALGVSKQAVHGACRSGRNLRHYDWWPS